MEGSHPVRQCFGCKGMSLMIKLKQNWMPKNKLLLKQLLVSTASFITLPFFKSRADGVREFFYANYCDKPDGLIFDGTTSGYFSKIEVLVDLAILDKQVIFDIGCGDGALLKWIKGKNVRFKKYIGIDFAYIPTVTIVDTEFILDDAFNVSKHFKPYQKQISFMTNSACYFDIDLLDKILYSFRKGDELIITEPSPNIFWDAHFKGVKPIYRNLNKLRGILQASDFEILEEVQDYAVKLGNKYLFPLSYCIHAKKLK